MSQTLHIATKYQLIYEGKSISKLQIVIEKKRMVIMTYKQHLFFKCNLHTNLNTCPTVPQVPGDLRCKILMVTVGTTRTLLFQTRHLQENVSPGKCCFRGANRWKFLCEYPLLPYLFPTKTSQRHAVLSWYTYSRARPSCNSCSVCTVMRTLIVARHNKTR